MPGGTHCQGGVRAAESEHLSPDSGPNDAAKVSKQQCASMEYLLVTDPPGTRDPNRSEGAAN